MTDEVLRGYRRSIDNIDAALVHLLAERFKVTQAVGRHKAEAGLPPADPGREEAQIARLRRLAEESELEGVQAASSVSAVTAATAPEIFVRDKLGTSFGDGVENRIHARKATSRNDVGWCR